MEKIGEKFTFFEQGNIVFSPAQVGDIRLRRLQSQKLVQMPRRMGMAMTQDRTISAGEIKPTATA